MGGWVSRDWVGGVVVRVSTSLTVRDFLPKVITDSFLQVTLTLGAAAPLQSTIVVLAQVCIPSADQNNLIKRSPFLSTMFWMVLDLGLRRTYSSCSLVGFKKSDLIVFYTIHVLEYYSKHVQTFRHHSNAIISDTITHNTRTTGWITFCLYQVRTYPSVPVT